jgi:hypothetical protein
MALEAGGGANVAGREQTNPELGFLMLRLTKDLVLPVTTRPGDEDPTVDSLSTSGTSCCPRCATGGATSPPPAASAWPAAFCASSRAF